MNWGATYLEQKVNITRRKDGAILLGKYVTCDGFEWDRPVAVCTHLHADHMGDFYEWLHYCQVILCSQETRELLIALKKDEALRLRGYFKGLAYGTPYLYKGECVTLYSTKHVLGSAQVLVEDEQGTRMVYTGDFDYPNTTPIKADILVIDATYGDPELPVFDKRQIVEQLIFLTKEELRHRPVCIIAHRGKLQEVMQTFNDAGLDLPFLCSSDIFRMSLIYQTFGSNLGDLHAIGDSIGQEVMKKQEPHIIFHLWSHDLRESLPEGISYAKIIVSRFKALVPVSQLGYHYYQIAVSDHSDFNGILEYVRGSEPKLVITDSSRGGYYATLLAAEIENRLGITAKAMP